MAADPLELVGSISKVPSTSEPVVMGFKGHAIFSPVHPTTPPPTPQVTPNDPYYSNAAQDALRWSKFDHAWWTSTGDPSIVVAIVDTGCTPHNDMTLNITRHSTLGDNGYDLVGVTGAGHGTRMCSILAADTNNTLGIAGAAWRVDLHSVKINPNLGFSTYTNGFELARNIADVRVIIVETDPNQSGLQNAFWTKVRQFMQSGGIVIMPSGNEDHHYTSDCDEPDVIVVGGLNIYTTPPSRWHSTTTVGLGSNYGPQIDMCAPISYAFCDHIDPTLYYTGQGTSGAAPHVAGAVALMLSVRPTLTAAQIKSCLFTTAVQPPPFTQGVWNEETGWGYLDAHAALAAAIALP